MTATVRQIRAEIRTARRNNRDAHARRDRNDNLYMLLLGILIYGGILVQAVRRMIRTPPEGPAALPNLPAAQWLVLGCAVLALGLLMRGLLLFGPVVAGSPFQFWLLSTPLDRKGLLGRRFWWSAGLATAFGALFGLALSALLRAGSDGKVLTTVVGATLTLTVFAVSVLLQAKANEGRPLSNTLIVAGALLAAAAAGLSVPTIDLPLVTVAIAVVPVVLVVQALFALGRLDRAALASGTEILTTTRAAVTWLDITMFSGISATRRWRRIGRVTSRPMRGTRYQAMLSAELIRVLRNRRSLLVWLGLLIAPYAAARVIPALFVPLVELVVCTIAVSPFASGLRSAGRSPALRRSLGGTDALIRLAHVVLPAVMALLWTAFAVPATGFAWAVLLVPVGAVAYAYRRATQPPMEYSGAAVDTPFGFFQPDVFRQMSRGPLLLLVLAAIQLNL
ncbi:DUF6297 family protein [Actinocrispum sp. NPDC049592]|uniref:DUF6297 family protein n=1 Tax=Actinocrispum sp. NPDC049592 TaxID=3154835 RepID=UPI0034213F7D